MHLGDLGCELSKEQKERLYGVDVLLIPVGGYYTIDAGQAAALAEEICPRAVIPMHFRSDADGFGFAEIGTAEQFTGQVKVREKEIAVLPGSTVDTGNMPDAAVVVLAPANAVAH